MLEGKTLNSITKFMTQLKYIALIDYRNYEKRDFAFNKKVVFWGQNGKGKTNVLEAISLLSVGKSWRETAGIDLIRNEESSALIEAKMENADGYKVTIAPRSRAFERNGKKVSLKQHFGRIPTLLFVPEYLNLFSGAKLGRQKYFDRFLAQMVPGYRESLIKFDRAKRQRNAVLKAHRIESLPHFEAEMQPWNGLLEETIPFLWTARFEFLKTLNPLLQHTLNKIAGSEEPIKIELRSPEPVEMTAPAVREFFKTNVLREVAAQRTLLGAHRDDFQFFLRDKPILSSASRGEERSVLLALLSSQKDILKKQIHQSPILLLDDVFSELDTHRQTHLEQLCEDSQVFFTTTHQEHFENFSGTVQKFEIA